MRAYAKILAPDDTEWLLGPGDRIGRLASAALTIDDARVSEAHAMISLRGGELRLLGPPSRRPACAPPRGRVAAELVAIVRRATAGDPAQRYADAGAFAADLQAYVDGRVVGAYRYSAWDQVRRPGWS